MFQTMRRSTDGMRRYLAIALVCALGAGCASEKNASKGDRIIAKPTSPKQKRKLSASERRELELLASIDKARVKKLEPRAMSKIEATAFREIAALRFERGDEPGAIEA